MKNARGVKARAGWTPVTSAPPHPGSNPGFPLVREENRITGNSGDFGRLSRRGSVTAWKAAGSLRRMEIETSVFRNWKKNQPGSWDSLLN